MSAYSTLYLSRKADLFDIEQDTVLLEASKCIPLCWLALFVPGDLRISNKKDDYHAVLVTSVAQARQRFACRLPLLTRKFPPLKDAFNHWTSLLDMIEQPFIKADLSEILETLATISEKLDSLFGRTIDGAQRLLGIHVFFTEEETRIRRALSYFENSSNSALEELFNITALKYHMVKHKDSVAFDDEWPYVIFGFDGADWLPWKNEAWWK